MLTRIITVTLFLFAVGGVCFESDALAGGKKKGKVNYFKVHAKGQLKTGIVAIGGETTGVLLKTDKVTVELDFKEKPALRRQANSLNGKTVIVQGYLAPRRGVTLRRLRLIVQVTSIKQAD